MQAKKNRSAVGAAQLSASSEFFNVKFEIACARCTALARSCEKLRQGDIVKFVKDIRMVGRQWW